uniref:Uncharacterized protein n=1 Tax=Trichuris muris TaxID=70415 RepID=A0A5S6QBC7_TRIMR
MRPVTKHSIFKSSRISKWNLCTGMLPRKQLHVQVRSSQVNKWFRDTPPIRHRAITLSVVNYENKRCFHRRMLFMVN